MLTKLNWKKKSIVFASLICFVVLPFYPSMGFAQDATPDKVPPKKVELAQAGGETGTGAAAGSAGAGAAAGLNPALVYGIVAGAVILGAVVVANSLSSDTTAQH